GLADFLNKAVGKVVDFVKS
uniref:Deserticolin-1 n=1 Tax=Crinia deserticola TaxID=104060 RepID=DES1_CRIDS|nr:RecName: Full=Deserticolin-1 [Crinia deserticola]